LGLGIEHDDKGEVFIAEIVPGYGAFAAGKALQPYDIIRAIDGRSVLKQPIKTIHGYTIGPEGSTCVLRISRGGSILDVEITRMALAEEDPAELARISGTRSAIAPNSEPSERRNIAKKVSLGFGAEVNDDGDIVITELVPGFAAYLSNQIVCGDVLLGVDGVNVKGLSMEAIADRTLGSEGEPCVLTILRGRDEFDVECIRVSPVVGRDSKQAEVHQPPDPKQVYGLAAPTFSDPTRLG